MMKKIYIIGHRNPDTDSVVSAAAYARLKRLQGFTQYIAARAGPMNPQTEYLFNRFKVPVPEYLSDLIPKADYYLSGPPETALEDVPLWEALDRMEREELLALPVVDQRGVYKSMLHYSAFARYIITNINPYKKAFFPVSIDHLLRVLTAEAEVLCGDDGEIITSHIVVAAAYNRYFKAHLERENPDNALVIMGDRWDLQELCIKRKVRALILSNSLKLGPGLQELAQENGVSVISSPYDTSSTAMLIFYSIPVGLIGDASVSLANYMESVKNIRPLLTRAPSRCLPIGDDDNKVMGVLFDGDLLRDPNIEVIMVDHNELSQAIEGIENYHIQEVIDHHRLGNISTRYPINFINRVVGATCTIIATMYREANIPLEQDIASLLLAGILADTLNLHSSTVTPVDMETAEYLSALTGLDIAELGNDLLEVTSQVNSRPGKELVEMDRKEYAELGVAYGVSQIETDAPDYIVSRKEEILEALEISRLSKNALFSALMVTDVTALDSLLFVSAEPRFMSVLAFPRIDNGIFELKEIVSRKKQLIPLLSELVEKMLAE